MEVRAGTRDDLDAIRAVALQACAEAIGELVPSDVVAAEADRRYPKALLCEHIMELGWDQDMHDVGFVFTEHACYIS